MIASIAVAGSVQLEEDDDGSILFVSPDLENEDQPVTGGRTRIAGNVVGLVGSPGSPAGDASNGIIVWAGASDLTIDSNTIGGASTGFTGVAITGGANHRVIGNRVGAVGAAVSDGITIVDSAAATIGAPDADANVLFTTRSSIEVDGASVQARIEANRINGVGGENVAIEVDAAATGATVISNEITGGSLGLVIGANGSLLTGNSVSDLSGSGIISTGDQTGIATNAVFGVGGAGAVVAGGESVDVSENRIGLGTGNAVEGNDGAGIVVSAGTVSVGHNIVAGSDADGIQIVTGVVGTLRGNRIFESGTNAISTAAGPDTPRLAGAIRSGTAAAPRTTLVINELPEGDEGTIEVFANDSCSDPEAKYVLEITRVKAPGDTARIIQIVGNESRDHFTVTYTDGEGRTSALSNCESRATYPDSDGDGVVDPIDELSGGEDDPTTAALVTDSEDILFLKVADLDVDAGIGGGRFELVAIVDDPDTSGHGEGWSLPYGAISFRVSELEPGGRTVVTVTTLSGDEPIAGTAYWKYGPQVAGGPAEWYDFTYDETSGTGAVVATTTPSSS
ncbi:MAG: right-handed parallel beta-helix repeat-containing protein, partial [Ilumatobacteraceae bacterium]